MTTVHFKTPAPARQVTHAQDDSATNYLQELMIAVQPPERK